MIDHVSLAVSDLDRARSFYSPLLAVLGFDLLADREGTIGYGKKYPEFWLNLRETVPTPAGPASGIHVCLRAKSKEVVEQFAETAHDLSAEIEAQPKRWPEYHESYYATFVQDPDGNRIEVVTFLPANAD